MRILDRLTGRYRAFRGNEHGSTTIEFAFAFPMVIAGFCGVAYLGLYFFNVHQMEETARQVARNMMLIDEPDLNKLEDTLEATMETMALPNQNATVEIEERDDGTNIAVIFMEMEMAGTTSFLDTDAFRHAITLRAPLLN